MRIAPIFLLIIIFTAGNAAAQLPHAPKIGIIGAGGSGLATAWLLEDRFDVVLVDKESRLGGHADTAYLSLEGQTLPVEMGFEFFNDRVYPTFNRYLQLLDVATRTYPLTYTFTWTHSGRTLFLPPFAEGGHFSGWQLPILLGMASAMKKGEPIVNQGPTGLTLDSFLQESSLPSWFTSGFFLPLAASMWGVSVEDIRRFEAYVVLKWLTSTGASGDKPPVFREVIGGMSAYAERVAADLKNTEIKLSTEVTSVSRRNGRYVLHINDSPSIEVDQLVIATGPYDARILLEPLENSFSAARDAVHALNRIESFRTTIAIHGDAEFMPRRSRDWGTANIRFDGKRSANTVFKHRTLSGKPIFKSWLSYEAQNGGEMPQPLYRLREYWHPKVTPGFFQAQSEISNLQGHQGLWLAGMYLGDLDNHESAIRSAVRIAEKMNPGSARLGALKAR